MVVKKIMDKVAVKSRKEEIEERIKESLKYWSKHFQEIEVFEGSGGEYFMDYEKFTDKPRQSNKFIRADKLLECL